MPTAKILVDSQFVIALINSRDKHHGRAVQLAREHRGQTFLITDAVLLEVGNALSRSHRAEAIEIIEDFLSSENAEVVRLTPELFERAFVLYSRCLDKDWSLVDCVSFTVMWEQGSRRALTSDRHFIQAGFQALLA